MKTSPSSSPTTSRRSTASRSMATWTTARRIRRSDGGSPTPGCRWPATATRASRTALPVDEWGIRMEGCRPVGSSVERGGDTNGPAAVYSITKYLDWMKKYAPPQAQGMTFSEVGTGAGAGRDRPADLLVHRLHRRHGEARHSGDECGRYAEVAYGAVAARLVLEGRHEARLSGRRLRDAAEVDAGRPPQGGLALSAVHRLQDGVA